MGLNETPSANRIHIGFFGKRNAGKSSVINAITNQEVSVVSDTLGTTTDPVYKSMELLPLGPVMLIDTAGIDDEGELGELRVKKTKQILNKTDIAVLVVDLKSGITDYDKELIDTFNEKKISYIVVYNKLDLGEIKLKGENEIAVSCKTKENINELKELIAKVSKTENEDRKIVADLISAGDLVILVTPIDESAPKGRLILPQQQTIRDILDANSVSIVCKETELEKTINSLKEKPKLVICDSQVFGVVDKIVPKDIALTSFSILFARFKGDLKTVAESVKVINLIENGDTILISEGCTHHRQCNDIGTVKIPKMIKEFTKKEVNFEFTSGLDFVEDFSKYKLIVHCGGCMLNDREMKHRINTAKNNNVPITNYGILIAYMNGILKRSVEIFLEIKL